jgi:hypothetical protein
MRMTVIFGILENLIGILGVLIAVITGILQARYFRHLKRASNDGAGAIEEATTSRMNNTLQ